MNKAYLMIGGNMGDRLQLILQTQKLLEQNVGSIIQQSAIYETQAWGNTEQAAFLNQALCVQTKYSASQLLQQCQAIEQALGRQRHEHWAARTMDIDILFYNTSIINKKKLIIPHPYIQERKFVLIPMCEIASDFVHPVLQRTMHNLLENCTDELNVTIFKSKI